VTRAVLLLAAAFSSSALAGDFQVDPKIGNNNFSATFDAKLGERINAVSSEVDCQVTYNEKDGKVSGTCSVPLTSIRVDNQETKTEHFQQWATNKKSDPKSCKLEAKFSGVSVGKLAPKTEGKFTAKVPFTVCGKARTDGGKETVSGSVMLFPAGSYGDKTTLRVRARIDKFNRELYEIGPGFTEGWLTRVQALAPVVSTEGTIELSLFATESGASTEPAKP
jgi:hypothetical protein